LIHFYKRDMVPLTSQEYPGPQQASLMRS